MDIFSHGLWTAAAGKGVNDLILKPKAKKPLKLRWLVWWGIFPDIFSFAVPFVWIISSLLFGNFNLNNIPRPETMEPVQGSFNGLYQLTYFLYNLSHSFIIFAAVFLIVSLIFRKFAWEMFGWAFHVSIDIFTHSYKFFPTPFLWPVSGIKFNGLSWGTPWFLIADYSAIVLAYFFLWWRTRNKA